MSYYFCIVGTRDNPLYQADLASKPAGSSGPASFFSSASSSSASGSGAAGFDRRSVDSVASTGGLAGTGASASAGSAGGSGATGGAGGNASTSGGVFGFGTALGALTGGLGSGVSSAGRATSAAGGPTNSAEAKGLGFGRYNDKHVLQMIAHSSLDVIEDKQFVNGLMYMKAVDRINEWTTSAFLAPGNIKLLILHEHKHDDGIRNFFYDVWELVVKVMMNPFHDINGPIESPTFDAKVRASARKHL